MKCIDSNFNPSAGNSTSIDNLLEKIKEIIISSGCDEKIIDEVLNESDNILIQLTDGKEYTIIMPGNNMKKMNFPASGAFKTNMVVDLTDKLSITPGICVRPGFLSEQLIHELFHAVSSKQVMQFNELGVVYTKTGTKIDYYDQQLNDYNQPKSVSSDLLNEGMTDYLTFLVTGDENKSHYYLGVVLADILNKNSTHLMEAYFSKDIGELVNFAFEFNNLQNIIRYEELVGIDPINIPPELAQRAIQGAVNYCLANTKENEYEQTVEYLMQKLEFLDKQYELDSGSWIDKISFDIEREESPNL